MEFCTPSEDSSGELTEFAVKSNATYGTTAVEFVPVAYKIFSLSTETFEKQLVEELRVDGERVGFYALKHHPPPTDEKFEYELGQLFVAADKARKHTGYGTALFQRALEKARSLGWPKLEWYSDPDATVFYLKMGCEIIGTDQNLLNPPVPVTMFRMML